jgi:spermidine/putrescine transport system substrate-binding protein
VPESAWTRREFCERALGLGLSASAAGALLAACGAAAKKTPVFTPSPMATTLPTTLHVWWFRSDNYMTPGIKKEFMEKYGVRVVDYFDDSWSPAPKNIDLMVVSDYLIPLLADRGFLSPVDPSHIPNAAQVMPKLANPSFDTWPDGRRYSVPYQWTVTGIGVRTDKVPTPITGWTDLWNPAYSQKIQMLNDEREDLGAALKKEGHSLNTLAQSELDLATNDLITQKPLVRVYDSIDPKKAMVKGMALTHCRSSDLILARWAGLSSRALEFVLPAEGYPMSVGNLCISKGTASPYAAHLFMNYMCDPAVSARLTNWTGYFSPIASAAPLLDRRIAALVPSDADLERGEIFNDLGAFAQNYSAAWQAVKGA